MEKLEEKYPAKVHARKVAANIYLINSKQTTDVDFKGPDVPHPKNGIIYAKSTVSKLYPNSDQEEPFRQHRNFYYITGCNLPDCYVSYDIVKDELTLYLPPVNKEDILWSGMPLKPKEALKIYDIDQCFYTTDFLKNLKFPPEGIMYVPDDNVEASYWPYYDREDYANHYHYCVKGGFDESRVIKDEYEINLMEKANEISAKSHLAVMQKRNIEKSEADIHAEFVYNCMRQGSKNQSYDPICCSGRSCSILHYVKNDQPLLEEEETGNDSSDFSDSDVATKERKVSKKEIFNFIRDLRKATKKQLVLIDAGAEWKNYASDVTRTWPISGEWTPEALAIYNLVKKMQTDTMKLIKPGVEWVELHAMAHQILIKGFIELGIFHSVDGELNNIVKDIFKSGVSVAFFPHGLGHCLGLDTHDVGGKTHRVHNETCPKTKNPMFIYLRIMRALKEGMVVTVEPGIYFNEHMIKPIIKNPNQFKFINKDALLKYWSVGGIRIEDDVLVTKDGYRNLTKLTSDPIEISKIIKESLS